jgi:starvation-inducible DNA-binding protein
LHDARAASSSNLEGCRFGPSGRRDRWRHSISISISVSVSISVSISEGAMKSKSVRIRMNKIAPTRNEAQPILDQRSKVIQAPNALVFYPLSLNEPARKASVERLNQVLADTVYLRDMYKKHHWQVSGHTFYQLHLLFDKFFEEASGLVDQLGERVQTLGGVAVAVPNDVVEMTKIQRPPRGREQVPVQLSRLLEGLSVILGECHQVVQIARKNGDDGTDNLISSEVIPTLEKQVWFLSQHLVDTPVVIAR